MLRNERKEKGDKKNEEKKSEKGYPYYQTNPSLAETSQPTPKTQKEKEWGLVSLVGDGGPSDGGAQPDGDRDCA